MIVKTTRWFPLTQNFPDPVRSEPANGNQGCGKQFKTMATSRKQSRFSPTLLVASAVQTDMHAVTSSKFEGRKETEGEDFIFYYFFSAVSGRASFDNHKLLCQVLFEKQIES